MEQVVWYIFGSIALISAISLIGVITFAVQSTMLRHVLPYLVALAAGGLFGGALFHLLPEALQHLSGTAGFVAVFGGVAGFFILERVLHWHHNHRVHEVREDCEDCEKEVRPYGHLILIADGLHNVLDGVVIAAAFLLGIEAGIIATVAVALHEIPQELGDFGVLVHAGFGRVKALAANLLSGLSAFLGAALTLAFSGLIASLAPFLTAAAAGGFLYIATVDLVPELHRKGQAMRTFSYLVVLAAGVMLMYFLTLLEG